MATILIISLCSTHRGDMESQLGNMAIFIPTVHLLRSQLGPGTRVLTTFQFSSQTQSELDVEVISDRAMLQHSFRQAPGLCRDLAKALLWRMGRFFGADIQWLRGGRRLSWFSQADLVLSLNGDVFGDNSSRSARLIRHWIDVILANLMGKPVVEYAGSPGPFATRWRKLIALGYFRWITVVTNREPLSSERMKADGILHPAVIDTACPAFALQPSDKEVAGQILLAEGIKQESRPWVGMSLCGYNLPSTPTWKSPTSLRDVEAYVEAAQALIEDRGALLLLIPHVHRWNPWTDERIHGLDWLILRRLRELLIERGVAEQDVVLFNGCYSASDTKAVLRELDLHVSGRLHSGVGALSQGVPTVLIAYGHKHWGFARILQQDRCVVDMGSSDAIKRKVLDVFDRREQIREELTARLPFVLEHVKLNFTIIADLLQLDLPPGRPIPAEWVEKWQRLAAQWGELTP